MPVLELAVFAVKNLVRLIAYEIINENDWWVMCRLPGEWLRHAAWCSEWSVNAISARPVPARNFGTSLRLNTVCPENCLQYCSSVWNVGVLLFMNVLAMENHWHQQHFYYVTVRLNYASEFRCAATDSATRTSLHRRSYVSYVKRLHYWYGLVADSSTIRYSTSIVHKKHHACSRLGRLNGKMKFKSWGTSNFHDHSPSKQWHHSPFKGWLLQHIQTSSAPSLCHSIVQIWLKWLWS